MDDLTHANGDFGENDEHREPAEVQSEKRHETDHADVLVHRQSGQQNGGIPCLA